MDITPLVPAGRQIIDSYRPGRFRVSGQIHQGSILVFPERTLPWPVAGIGDLTVESFSAVGRADPAVEVLLLGCGARMTLLPSALRRALREAGLKVDVMDTGAACRTYNILMAESRRVAAALIALAED